MIKADRDTVSFPGKQLKCSIPFGSARNMGEPDHDKLAKALIDRACETASVIVIVDRVSDELVHDPKFVRVHYSIMASEIENKARGRAKYPSMEEVDEKIKELGLELKVDNFRSGKIAKAENDARYTKMIDLMMDAHVRAQYPSVIEDAKREFKEEWGKKLGFDEAWEKELMRQLYPATWGNFERVLNVPDIFKGLDSRSVWHQFYFVGCKKIVGYERGGSASSGAREYHGRWAHAFAALGEKGVETPTFVYRYTSENNFVLEKSFEKFRCMSHDLYGNYQADWSKTKSLFTNRLMSINTDDNGVRLLTTCETF